MPRRHVVLALVVAVCWAVNFVVIDIGLESFPPLLFAALRFGLTAFPAIFFVPRPDVRWRAVVAVGLFIGVGQFGVLFVAMNTGLPAGLASVIAPLQPVFTIPFAVIALGERPSLRQVIGVSLAIAGLGAIAGGRARGVPFQAVALGVASAASWGCGNVVTRAAKPKRPFSLLVWSSVVAPLPLLGLSLIFESTGRWQSAVSSVGASGLAALAYVVVVSTFFGYGSWYWLMSRYPASTVAPFTLLVPVVGILTAWLVRGEHPTWGELLGSLVVLVGLGLALGARLRAGGERPACAANGCSDARSELGLWRRFVSQRNEARVAVTCPDLIDETIARDPIQPRQHWPDGGAEHGERGGAEARTSMRSGYSAPPARSQGIRVSAEWYGRPVGNIPGVRLGEDALLCNRLGVDAWREEGGAA
jgi:O-acetylserine/cysteine efflux transporter